MNTEDDLPRLEGEFGEIASKLSLWQALIRSPGWKLFEEAVEGSLGDQQAMLRTPLLAMDQVLAQEFSKGRLVQAGLLLGLPHTQIEQLKHEQDLLQKEIDDVKADADAMGADGGSRERNGQRRELLDDGSNPFNDG